MKVRIHRLNRDFALQNTLSLIYRTKRNLEKLLMNLVRNDKGSECVSKDLKDFTWIARTVKSGKALRLKDFRARISLSL